MEYVRVGQFRSKPGEGEALSQVYERDAIPVIRAAPGNVSAVLLRQHQEDDVFLAITIWKDQGAAEAYDRSGLAQSMVGKVKHLFAGPPTLTTWSAYGIPSGAR